MLETHLIEYCAPTLASLKTANLFCCPIRSEEWLREQVTLWNRQLFDKGISVVVVRIQKTKALIYVYRVKKLQEALRQKEISLFLTQYGYRQDMTHQEAIIHLQERLKNSDGFPHEIGVFLGYPLGDVIGFIQNDGKNSRCSGCWKVYCNECETMELFRKFKKCQEVYKKLFKQGRSVLQLTVAVS